MDIMLAYMRRILHGETGYMHVSIFRAGVLQRCADEADFFALLYLYFFEEYPYCVPGGRWTSCGGVSWRGASQLKFEILGRGWSLDLEK